MSVMTRRARDGRSRLPLYKIVLALDNGDQPRPLAFATNIEHASATFHALLEELRRDQLGGELQVCDLRDKERVVMYMRLRRRNGAVARADGGAP